jgi:hypothetical protein
MTLQTERANLIQVKQALAAKYTNLAKVIKSRPRQKVYLNLAAKFLRQAGDLQKLGVR